MTVLKKVSLASIAYPVSPSGINERNTVSAGPDDGTNNKLASHFWNCRRHITTTQAVDNLLVEASILEDPKSMILSRMMTGACNIGGHGNEGLLETGMGQNGQYDVNKLIYLWNESEWGPQLDRLKSSSCVLLSIWSCHTGAGQDGADLLFAMAKHFGRPVRAGTGFLFNTDQNTWRENGSQQQVATPDNKPEPIPAPTVHQTLGISPMFQVAGKVLETSEVVEIRFVSKTLVRKIAPKAVYKKDAVEVASRLFLGPPIELSASVSAIVTIEIEVVFRTKETITFFVYNDRLAVDPKTDTAYYLSPGINRLLETL